MSLAADVRIRHPAHQQWRQDFFVMGGKDISGRMTTTRKLKPARIFTAVISGLLLTAAFPNIEWHWTAWFALVPLLFAVRSTGPKAGFMLGWIGGLAHYLTLIYWTAYTMRVYGYLPWALCILVLLLFAGFLALFWGVFGAAAAWAARRPPMAMAALPLLWVSLEYIRSILFTGFPWELIGHSQYRLLPLVQISDLFGVYGVSFVIAWINGAVFMLLLFASKVKWQGRSMPGRLAGIVVLASITLVAVTVGYGLWRMQAVASEMTVADEVRLSVVQGNIPQSEKWDPAFQIATLDKYLTLSAAAARQDPDLIVWPETATPFYFRHDRQLTARLLAGIRRSKQTYLIGSPSVIKTPHRVDHYNSAYLIGPDGRPQGVYHKTHLVPFGEYVPLKKYLPFLGKMVAQVGDFSRGNVGDTISWRRHRLGVLICYELIFPYLARAAAENQAHLLINITNDAWYGRTSAPFQHFSMAVFRAVENRRSLIRAANTGISGFIDPLGRIIASTPLFEDAVMTRNVPIMTRSSVYTRIGDGFAWFCLLATALLGVRFFFFPTWK